jgi:hypothetical protein
MILEISVLVEFLTALFAVERGGLTVMTHVVLEIGLQLHFNLFLFKMNYFWSLWFLNNHFLAFNPCFLHILSKY